MWGARLGGEVVRATSLDLSWHADRNSALPSYRVPRPRTPLGEIPRILGCREGQTRIILGSDIRIASNSGARFEFRAT